ncbi:MAG: DUF1501 domain-containing protein [Planctomycetota bacterium]|nr:DUF1501 domain-containing protein [Planctomycetota bacterium]
MTDGTQNFDRRRLLTGAGALLGASWFLSGRTRAWAQPLDGKSGDPAPRTLLLLELNGGNDGLDTLIPFGEDVYHASRTRVGIDAKEVLRLDDYHGFHPALAGLRGVWDEGQLAIVEGAGYPNPNHSHFTSQDIWHTGQLAGRASGDGWIGRLMARLYPTDRSEPHAVHVGQTLPYSLHSATHPIVCFDSPPAYRWAENGKAIAAAATKKSDQMKTCAPLDTIRGIASNAQVSSAEIRKAAAQYVPRVEYPKSDVAQDLKTAAALLSSGIGVRVMSVTHYGYDTHEDHRRRHDVLMSELDGGLTAFLRDMRGTAAGDNCLVMVFSEFGRRVADNASNGIDHGTAGPMFLTGTPVKGGLYGKHPSLQQLVDGDLVYTTDFRTVYAGVLERWFGVESEPILGARYDALRGFLT